MSWRAMSPAAARGSPSPIEAYSVLPRRRSERTDRTTTPGRASISSQPVSTPAALHPAMRSVPRVFWIAASISAKWGRWAVVMNTRPQSARPEPLFSRASRAAARAAATASDSVESPTPAFVATGRNLSWVRQLIEIGVPVQCLEFIDFDDPGARRRILGDGRAKQGEGLLPSGGCRFDARQAEVEPGHSREVPP